MLFIIICVDKPDAASRRAENRSDHLDYLTELGDRLVAAGPTLTEDGAKPTGSVLVVSLEDRAAAEAFAAGDPYNQAGVFASVTLHRWKQVFPFQSA